MREGFSVIEGTIKAMSPNDLPTEAVYVVKGNDNVKEALGFIKDWATAIIQIETAIIGALGATFVLKDTADIKINILPQLALLGATIAFAISIVFGVFLLNMLPGAVQRVSIHESNPYDVYSIYTKSVWGYRPTIYTYTLWFRWSFFVGLFLIAVFVLFRIIPYTNT